MVHGEFTNFDKWKGKCAVISLAYIDHFKQAMLNLVTHS